MRSLPRRRDDDEDQGDESQQAEPKVSHGDIVAALTTPVVSEPTRQVVRLP
jgi:hypothetical protein